jgi:NDP-sugar pyrophosphorylase family protein
VLAEMLAAGDVGALALRRNDGASLSPAATLENGRVRAFRDQGPSRAGPFPISGGVYALRRSILDHIVATSCAIEADVFPALAEAQLLAGAELDGYFLDICLSDALEQAQRELPQQFIGLL